MGGRKTLRNKRSFEFLDDVFSKWKKLIFPEVFSERVVVLDDPGVQGKKWTNFRSKISRIKIVYDMQ